MRLHYAVLMVQYSCTSTKVDAINHCTLRLKVTQYFTVPTMHKSHTVHYFRAYGLALPLGAEQPLWWEVLGIPKPRPRGSQVEQGSRRLSHVLAPTVDHAIIEYDHIALGSG